MSMMSLTLIKDTEVFTNSNFSSAGKTLLLNELVGIKNLLAIKEMDIFGTHVITLLLLMFTQSLQ